MLARDPRFGPCGKPRFDEFRRWWHREKAKAGRGFSRDAPVSDAEGPGEEEDQVGALLSGLKNRAPPKDVMNGVAELLTSTPSERIRNAAALALADSGQRDTVSHLVSVLRDGRIAKQAGTPLFALDELGGSLPLDVAVDLIANGSYEARAETLFVFEDDRIEGSEDRLDEARLSLGGLAASGDTEIAEAAGLALGFLERHGGARLVQSET